MEKFLVRAGSSQAPDPGPHDDKTRAQAVGHPPPKKKKPVANKATVKSWGFDWLQADTVSTVGKAAQLQIHCVACRTYARKTSRNNRGSVSNDPFILGTTNTKKFSAVRHSQSQGHKHAYDSWKNDTKTTQPIVKAVIAMDEKSHSKMVKLFDICYHLAKHELPFAYYPSLVNLEKRHGVELGCTYQNPVQAHTFTEFLAEDIREKVDEAVRKARYVSILVDGSTDRSTSEKELMYVKYLEDGIPRTRFFSIQDVQSANADGILEALNTTFEQHNIPDWKNNLIGFCADGASVNFGRREGVVAKLAAEVPWLLGIHCIAHRLELAAKNAFKDSFFTKEIDAFLTLYASFYRKSPKRFRELSNMADLLEEKILRPTRADGTRWVDHRRRALHALVRNYPSVVAHLTELGSEQRSDINKDDAAKARGMVKKMSSYKFVLHVALYIDVLEELSHLSLLFQQSDICFSDVMEHLRTTKSVLADMADGEDGAKLQSIKKSCRDGTYQGVVLSGVEVGSAAEFDAARKDLVQPLVTCLGQRYSSFTENNVFSAISSLDPKTWPNDIKDFAFDDGAAQILIEHFNDTLIAHGGDPDQAVSEWGRLKKVIPLYYKPTTTWQSLWGTLLQKRQGEFPSFLQLVEIIQVLPFATAQVERGFSLMNRVKSDWRVRLNTCTLDDLMMISLEGPSEEEYPTSSAVARWHKAGKQSRRPNVQPYGQRLADSMDESL